MTESCLVAKLSAFATLSPRDEKLLRALEKDERAYRKDHLVRRAGAPADEFHVVKSGVSVSFSVMEDGRRQLLKLFYPGDIVDTSDAALARARQDVKCLTQSILCPFPRSGLEEIFATSPRLSALLFAMTVRENDVLLARIRAIGRFSAYERVCHLLLEVRDRLAITDPDAAEVFRMPLTQLEIADLLGLTNVYVSKTLSRIEADGLIRREGNRVRVLDPRRMREVCEYRPPGEIETSWFPEG